MSTVVFRKSAVKTFAPTVTTMERGRDGKAMVPSMHGEYQACMGEYQAWG